MASPAPSSPVRTVRPEARLLLDPHSHSTTSSSSPRSATSTTATTGTHTAPALPSPRAHSRPPPPPPLQPLLSPRRVAPMAPSSSASSPSSVSTPATATASASAPSVPTPPTSASNTAGTLRVEVISAQNLHAAVLSSLFVVWRKYTSNPYVVVTLHRDEFTTATKQDQLSPTWNETSHFNVPLPTEQELLQTSGLHRNIHGTSAGHRVDGSGKLGAGALSAQKLQSKHSSGNGNKPDFHACFPHLHIQVYHQTDQPDAERLEGTSRRALDQLIGEVFVPVLPCLLSSSSSHRGWYPLVSDDHPDAGQIQIAMHYDVGGLTPQKGDIVRLAGFCGMEYYAKLVNANARLDVVDVFQDEVLVEYKSSENWMLSFELHRNLLCVVRRPSRLRDAQSHLEGHMVRVRQSPIVARAHSVWQAIPASQRQQLFQLYELARFSGVAACGVVTTSVHTAVSDGFHAGVQTCMESTTEAANQVSMEAMRVFWRSQSHDPTPTRAEEMARYLEGGPLSGRGKIVQGFEFGDTGFSVANELLAMNGSTSGGQAYEEEKTNEDDDDGGVQFVVDPCDDDEQDLEDDDAQDELDDDDAEEDDGGSDEEQKTNDATTDLWLAHCPDQLLCPITGCPMLDPVVAADGHSYERVAIVQWFATSNKSPMTGAQMPTTQVFPNATLRQLSEEFQSKVQHANRSSSSSTR